jgi:pyridoxamine 5'-phosphate oxidase
MMNRMTGDDPIAQFLAAAARAEAQNIDTAPASLATSTPEGRSSVRIVLVRQVDIRGFVFFTNYGSRKGRHLAANPLASLCYHWIPLEEQIRIEGFTSRISAAESDAYFATRPRGSQIGAWASRQSERLRSREDLEKAYADQEARFEGGPVPRPHFWGGYRIVPERIEFWYGRADRLHDRVLYVADGAGWRTERLYP